ncbi:CDP-2,3-bis-(O-geranylgeranyl)-sn-glycerol synthase [Candidatus Bathyarchaeota archaeon]|nr:MAG: CDP-2,3-bis-(O-geranylgeranyl)-sn-glycerol synthase [Candidatus Bathyarchaeota archaeon]
MDMVQLVIEALKFIFPAYCANAIPVITGGGPPIDFGKKFYDGKPIFGKNKTFRGFFSGLMVGTIVGLIEGIFFEEYSLYFGMLLSLGALLGDLAGSFLKRRLGLTPGDLLPIIDQIDFILGAILLSLPLSFGTLSRHPLLCVVVLILTIPIHMLTNFAAYKLGLKSNPW